MPDTINQDEINAILWKACDTFRGTIDPSEYKNYILVMLFVKYISDMWFDHYAQYEQQFGGDAERIERRMSREPFRLPKDSDFYTLYERRNQPNVGEEINIALEHIEEANKEKLDGVFRNIDFNSEAALGKTAQRNERLKDLLEAFHSPNLNMRPSIVDSNAVASHVLESVDIICPSSRPYREAGFYAPRTVASLMAKLLNPQPGEHICDPTCGAGSLLVSCVQEIDSENYSLYGQEINEEAWQLCLLNLMLHGINTQVKSFKLGNTLTDPLSENGELLRFDAVISNPPIGLRWDTQDETQDVFQRFRRGIPPSSNADYAFISHIVESLNETGRAVILISQSTLFRGSREGNIRRQLVEENLVDAVIGLPSNLLYGTGIPPAILILNRSKSDSNVLFIDASKGFESSRIANQLRDQDVEKIIAAYRERRSVENFSHVVSQQEISENDFNLNIARYVFAYEIPDEQIIVGTGPDQYDVFISYSHRDTNHKKRIVDELLAAGMRIWDDDAYTLEVGTPDWQIKIARSIEAANCVVVLLSPSAKESEWVLRELGYAQVHQKPIFPVLVEGDEKTSVPLLLINTQRTDFQNNDREQSRRIDIRGDDLIDTLKHRVGIQKIQSPYIYDLTKQKPDWKRERLVNLVELLRPKQRIDRNDLAESGEYPFYGPSGVVGYSDTYEFEGEYLLVPGMISSVHERFARNAWKPGNTRFSASQEVWVLKPHDRISIDFLLYTLWVTDFRPFISSSVGRRRVSLKDMSIAVPPLDEQIQIVEYIAEHMGVIEARQRGLESRLNILASRKIGVIHRMFYMHNSTDTDK